MIDITDHTLFGKDGILIEYDDDKDIFFTDNEAEKIRDFLNERKSNLRNRILTILESEKVTLGDLIKELNVDRDIIDEELMKLEDEGIICKEGKRVERWGIGNVFIPLFKKKE